LLIYSKEIKVIAKDASGNVVKVPADQILDVTVSNDAAVVGKVADGKWYIAGNKDVTEDTKVTLSVVYNAEDGVKTLTQDVTVSKDKLKVVSVKFKDKPVGATDAKDVTSLTVTDSAELKGVNGFGKAFVWAQDQFGGYTLADTAAEVNNNLRLVAVSGVTGTADDTITVAVNAEEALTGNLLYNDGKNDTKITAAGAKLRVVSVFNGVAGSLDITIKNAD
ncbi:hypothetical protein ABEO87_14915, partial [Geobacillus stearothermophilus]|uniref:hypothetical protein n=1 Tax=Geobacillus stearothermophilus TaxID=1422 RepID=UPI003D205177